MRYAFLSSTEHALFEAAFDLYELSIPALRRDRDDFARAFADPAFECLVFREGEALVGLATRWFLPQCVFLESLVVAPEFRRLGLGSQHLQEILSSCPQPVAALVPAQATEALAFFQKNGFLLDANCIDRVAEGKTEIFTFSLVSHPKSLAPLERNRLLEDLSQIVYSSFQSDFRIQVS